MERSVTVQDMVKGLWRRRRLVATVSALVFAVGLAAVVSMPSVYKATAVVRVEQPRPSHELIEPTVTQLIEERLKTVRQELLARPLLEKVITELNLYPKLRQKKGMEAAVDELSRELDVKVEGENAFELVVTGDDAVTVAKIANRLPELYAAQTTEIRQKQAALAAGLYDEEIAKLDKLMQQKDKEITDFKVAHLGELPEQMESNMRGLERVVAMLNGKNEARRELQRRAYDLDRARTGADSEVGRARHHEDEISGAFVAAKSRWTEDHPEVQRLERELAVVKSQREAAEARAHQDDAERASIRRQLATMDAELSGLEAEAQHYRDRIDKTPQWGQSLNVMARDYDMVKAKYNSLVSRKVEAELARDLEAKARAGMFNVLSPAAPPVAPFKPDRATAAILALLVALGAGALAGIFRELQDDSLRGLDQARELPLPVLAVVPEVAARGNKAAEQFVN